MRLAVLLTCSASFCLPIFLVSRDQRWDWLKRKVRKSFAGGEKTTFFTSIQLLLLGSILIWVFVLMFTDEGESFDFEKKRGAARAAMLICKLMRHDESEQQSKSWARIEIQIKEKHLNFSLAPPVFGPLSNFYCTRPFFAWRSEFSPFRESISEEAPSTLPLVMMMLPLWI